MSDTTRDARRVPAARQQSARHADAPAVAPADAGSDDTPPEIESPTSRRIDVMAEEPDLTTTAHSLGESDPEDASAGDIVSADVEPSLNDQPLLTDPIAAAGDPDDWEDPVAEGDEAYVPPMDPVVTTDAHGQARVLGGFSADATVERSPLHSSDGQIGDEAIADAVRAALRDDAATTDLQVDVAVEGGIVRLFGTVSGMEDVDNAEAVAERVPGVVDVVEELQVASV